MEPVRRTHPSASTATLMTALVLLLAGNGCGSSSPKAPTPGYNNLDPSVLPPGFTVSSQAAITKNVQALPGWQICVGTCANAPVPAAYTLTQNVASPSLNNDGSASSMAESGTPYGDVMWNYHIGDSAATHFVIDLYVNIDHPENVQALEIAILKNDGLNWYKMEVQCNYQTGSLRGFNIQTFEWQDIGANCILDQANTWQRITLQFTDIGGTSNYQGVSFDGIYQPLSTSLPPEPQTTPSELMGVHFQLDNSNTTNGYTVYVDDWTVYSW